MKKQFWFVFIQELRIGCQFGHICQFCALLDENSFWLNTNYYLLCASTTVLSYFCTSLILYLYKSQLEKKWQLALFGNFSSKMDIFRWLKSETHHCQYPTSGHFYWYEELVIWYGNYVFISNDVEEVRGSNLNVPYNFTRFYVAFQMYRISLDFCIFFPKSILKINN